MLFGQNCKLNTYLLNTIYMTIRKISILLSDMIL